jgi:hypothetical protein
MLVYISNLESPFPGPGMYDQTKASGINGKGFTYWSKFQSSTAKSLTGKPKDSAYKNNSIFI